MNTFQLTASVTALANLIASKLTREEITLLATIIVQLGDTLTTISTQRVICEAEASKD